MPLKWRAPIWKRLAWSALAVCAGCASLGSASPAAVASAYSRAFVAGDCDALERLSSEAIRRRAGGPDALKAFLCGFVTNLRAEGYAVREVVAETGPEFREGRTRLVLIPMRRTGVGEQGTIVMESTYVVHSSDGGASWSVLDLGCVDERWLKEVAPTYDGNPPLTKARRTFVPK